MSDQRLVDELHVALASPAPLAARSRVVPRGPGVPRAAPSCDAAWLALAHPTSGQHVVVATRGLGAVGAAIALVVGWLIVDAHLWDRPEDDSRAARERARLSNASTLLTLTAGAVVC